MQKCKNAKMQSQFFAKNRVSMRFMRKMWYAIIYQCEKNGRQMSNVRKARNARNLCNFSHKKVRNRKYFSLFLWFFAFFTFSVLCKNFSRYPKRARNAIWEKWKMQEIMHYEKSYFSWLIECEKYARNARKSRNVIIIAHA